MRDDVRLRTATVDELGLILDWAAAEGWNPGLGDALPFHATDPDGFFLAEAEGRPVAAISVVNHDERHAFLGLYLCLPDWRGRGIGLALWHHALAHAGNRTVGLDGVAAQQANYAKSGFVLQGATTRLAGRLAGATDRAIRPVGPGDVDALVSLDAASGGVKRARFLSRWLEPETGRQSVMLAEGGGFATIRACRSGAKIGPVIAPDADLAMRLVRAALAALPCDTVAIDLPATSAALRDRLQELDFAPVFQTARMSLGPPPQGDGRVQAIATMELG
ncbi:GNAT family N-acetyltransferase [Neotabrizicola shimadae]|uniref:GNAT family N-acetyltransferase n=2 Tax=Neotabrizicola shimadae TaxID=2807096 RepID=A0A8G0ZV63_9RHOB|nr:GNAT family N-acetyltransferase [Neotabrizicola shimadae]